MYLGRHLGIEFHRSQPSVKSCDGGKPGGPHPNLMGVVWEPKGNRMEGSLDFDKSLDFLMVAASARRPCLLHYQQSRASQSQRQASVKMHVRSIQHHQTESSCPTTQHNTMGFHVLRESNHAIVIWVEVGRYA